MREQQSYLMLLVKEKYWWLHSISEYDGKVANEGYYTPHIIKRIEGHKIDKNSQQNTPLIKIFQTHD
jgi:hypothetical protein